jgi:hypothetical protein
LIALPEAIRVLRGSAPKLLRMCLAIGGSRAAVALAWGAVVWLAPERLGVALLHEAWPPARQLLVPMTLWLATWGLIGGAEVGLRALAAASRSLRAQLLGSALLVAGMLGGAAAGDALGAVWGLAGGSLVAAGVWWRQLGHGLADHNAKTAVPDRSGSTV